MYKPGREILNDALMARDTFLDIHKCETKENATRAREHWKQELSKRVRPAFQRFLRDVERRKAEVFSFFEFLGPDERKALVTNGCVERRNHELQELSGQGAGYSFRVLRLKALLAFGREPSMATVVEIPSMNAEFRCMDGYVAEIVPMFSKLAKMKPGALKEFLKNEFGSA